MQSIEKQLELHNMISNSTSYLSSELHKFTNKSNKDNKEVTRLVRQMTIENQGMFNKIQVIKGLCELLKQSLEEEARAKKLQNNEGISKMNQMQNNSESEIPPPLAIKNIKKLERADELECFRVANKLKVLVSKVCHERTSAIRYDFTNYVDRMMFDLKEDKVKTSPSIESKRIINEALLEIKTKFKISTAREVSMYRRHCVIKEYVYDAVFCVNFYHERLLFFREQPLSWNNFLLFCPIILQIDSSEHRIKNSELITVHPHFTDQLYKQNHYWQDFTITLIIRKIYNSGFDVNKTQKIYHSKCSVKKFGNKINEKSIMSQLRKIRGFMYMTMIMKWLLFVLKNDCYESGYSPQEIQIYLDKETTAQITTGSFSLDSSSENYKFTIEKPKMIQQFISYFSEDRMKQRNERSPQDVLTNLKAYLKLLVISIEQESLCEMKSDQKQSSVIKTSEYVGAMKYFYAGNRKIKL